jgi:hypothetical protein
MRIPKDSRFEIDVDRTSNTKTMSKHADSKASDVELCADQAWAALPGLHQSPLPRAAARIPSKDLTHKPTQDRRQSHAALFCLLQ